MPVTSLTEELMDVTARTVKYPNPFFDLANAYVPKNIKTLFKFCRDYYHTNTWLRNVVNKMATYPITDILFETSTDAETIKKLSEVLNSNLKIKSFLIEVGLDYYTFGNEFISIFLKPKRFLICSACKESHPFEQVRKINLKNYDFYGKCPSCKKDNVAFMPIDEPIKNIENFKLVRWAADNIDIDYNPITGSSIYYYTIPNKVKSQIIKGNPAILQEIPLVFLQALKEKKRIELEPSNLYHFKYPTLAEEDMGFGKPMILPALKEIYYLQTLRRGNEAIANEHIVPKKTISPANTATMDPLSAMSLRSWRAEMETTIKKWKTDPNYIAVFPIPTTYQELGGNARMLMVTNEMKFLEETIINSLGVPLEFIKGGTSWTGSSVSLRIVENGFLNYRELLNDFLNHFLMPKLTSLLGLPAVNVHFKKFKMSDDSESKQLAVNLNSSGKLSDIKLLDEFGYSYEEEKESNNRIRVDSMATQTDNAEKQAEAQGKAMIIQAQYQVRAQRAAADEQLKITAELFENEIAMEHGGVPEDPFSLIDKYALQLIAMPPDMQQQAMMQMQQQRPTTFSLVMQRLPIYQQQMQMQQQTMMNMMPAPSGQQPGQTPPNQQTPGTREQDKVPITKDDSQKRHGPTRGEV